MTDPRRPFPPPPPSSSSSSSSSASPRMHHCALPPSFVTSPPPHPHQSGSQFVNHSDQSHVQTHFGGQSLDTALESSDWSPAQFPSMLSGYTCTEQNWDFHTSSQNLFNSTALNYDSFQSEVFHYPDPQSFQSSSFFSQTTSTADLSHWGQVEPTTPQLQCSSLGYTSRDAALGSWSSADYNFSPNTDSFLPFYPNSYQENHPHYPPSFVTSPTGENGTEKVAFQPFVEPGTFTAIPEIKSGQHDVIQKQTKARKTTRGRGGGGGGGGRPRKSRTDKKKATPLPERPVPVDVFSELPPSLLQRSDVEEEI
ncbi:hypothetical protein WMY93_022389 [Mugilogobius chulae]|uniref:Uncharacterized protein n=1 Tax=Mugilogobius chulae TaxID=88201 RepID=A0AAW0NI12_9GOBI